MKMLSVTYIFILAVIALAFGGSVFAITTTDEINVNLNVYQPGDNDPPSDDQLEITNINVIVGTSTALITWNTNLDAFSTLDWAGGGQLGTFTEEVSGTSHSLFLTDLIPGTTYYFDIFAYEDGDETNTDQVLNQTFTTLPLDNPPPSNPLPFTATYDPSDHDINLDWDNPPDPDFDVVRIMRRTDFFPLDPEDGDFIYEGSLEFFEDLDIEWGTTYYYTIFARDFEGSWSSGSVDTATVPPEACDPDDPNCEEPDPECEGEDCPAEPCQDPFGCEPPEPPPPGFDDLIFKFTQNDRGTTLFTREGQTVFVNGLLDLKTHIDYDELPEILKAIGITLRHPRDKNKVFSFLLRVDGDKDEYAATVAPLIEDGVYDMTISIMDFENERIVALHGKLDVEGTESLLPEPLGLLIENFGKSLGVLAGLTQTIIVTSNVKSIYDIWLLVLRGFWALMSFLGLRKKSKPWGIVYDSVTKRPLDPAYVTVMAGQKEVQDAITDLDGRYGFFLPEGVYNLQAKKTHYKFPSEKLSGQTKDELYDNLYFGEPVATEEGEIINKNIPLDPIGFDWNEFIKNKQGLFQGHENRERWKNIIFNSIFFIGFLFTLFAVFVTPSLYNFVILGLYVVMFVFQTFWKRTHKAIQVRYEETEEPLSFAVVRIFMARLNQLVKTTVADEFGRFYALVSPGNYYYTVDIKNSDGTYSQIYKSEVESLEKGVLKGDVVIRRDQ